MGTAGALLPLLGNPEDTVLILNGDSWFDIDFRAFATGLPNWAVARIALRRTNDLGRFGVVEISDGRVTRFADRNADVGAGYINAGIILCGEVLSRVSQPSHPRWKPISTLP